MFEAISHALPPLAIVSAFLAAVLGGVFLGLRIATRDAAMLASIAKESRAAIAGAEAAIARADTLEQAWTLQTTKLNQLRNSMSAAASRAERAEAKAADEPAAVAARAPSLTERRKAVAQRLRATGAMQ